MGAALHPPQTQPTPNTSIKYLGKIKIYIEYAELVFVRELVIHPSCRIYLKKCSGDGSGALLL